MLPTSAGKIFGTKRDYIIAEAEYQEGEGEEEEEEENEGTWGGRGDNSHAVPSSKPVL